jgi:4-hydroxy-2-oxoglutarate aldolase
MLITAAGLSGVFAPLPTPFDRGDRLDVGRLRAGLDRWIASPLAGFVVLGSNGEAPLIDDTESERVVAVARELVPDNRPLVAGTGRESTQATVRATRRAAALGADAAMVRTPGFFKAQMTDDAFVRHYAAVADASPIPILLYNFTAVTGVMLAAEAVARLASHPNIVGIKESSGDLSRLSSLIQCANGDFAVLTGSATTFYGALCAGAAGGILAISAVVPDACARLFALARAGRRTDAEALQERLLPLARLLGSTYGVPALKAALNLSGFDVGYPRPPLAPPDEPAIAAVRDALHALQESVV